MHAAACRLRSGQGVLIPGRTRAGKTTLIGLLAHRRGAETLSDDTVWVSGQDVSSIGAPLAVREGSPLWEHACALWYAGPGDRLLVRAVDIGAAGTVHTMPVTALVVPHFSAGTRPSIETLAAAEAFCHLSASALKPCDDVELEQLARLAAQHPAAAISYPDPAAAVDLVDEAVALEVAPSEPVEWMEQEVLTASGLPDGVRGIRLGADCAVWNPALARIAPVRHWDGTRPCDTDVLARLRAALTLGDAPSR